MEGQPKPESRHQHSSYPPANSLLNLTILSDLIITWRTGAGRQLFLPVLISLLPRSSFCQPATPRIGQPATTLATGGNLAQILDSGSLSGLLLSKRGPLSRSLLSRYGYDDPFSNTRRRSSKCYYSAKASQYSELKGSTISSMQFRQQNGWDTSPSAGAL